MYETLFDHGGLTELAAGIVGGQFFDRHIHLDALRIHTPYRGKRVGLVLISRLIETFGKPGTLVTLRAWPLDEDSPSSRAKRTMIAVPLADFHARRKSWLRSMVMALRPRLKIVTLYQTGYGDATPN